MPPRPGFQHAAQADQARDAAAAGKPGEAMVVTPPDPVVVNNVGHAEIGDGLVEASRQAPKPGTGRVQFDARRAAIGTPQPRFRA